MKNYLQSDKKTPDFFVEVTKTHLCERISSHRGALLFCAGSVHRGGFRELLPGEDIPPQVGHRQGDGVRLGIMDGRDPVEPSVQA